MEGWRSEGGWLSLKSESPWQSPYTNGLHPLPSSPYRHHTKNTRVTRTLCSQYCGKTKHAGMSAYVQVGSATGGQWATTSPWILHSFKRLKKWKSTSKHQCLWTSIMSLGTHQAHTLLYPNCIWTMLGTVFTNHSSAMDKSLCLDGFPKPVLPLALCSNDLYLPGWELYLHDGCQPTLELSAPSP